MRWINTRRRSAGLPALPSLLAVSEACQRARHVTVKAVRLRGRTEEIVRSLALLSQNHGNAVQARP